MIRLIRCTTRAILIRGQGAEGLIRLARYALDVLAQLERHDDASARYLKRLRYLGDQIMMIYDLQVRLKLYHLLYISFFHIFFILEEEMNKNIAVMGGSIIRFSLIAKRCQKREWMKHQLGEIWSDPSFQNSIATYWYILQF